MLIEIPLPDLFGPASIQTVIFHDRTLSVETSNCATRDYTRIFTTPGTCSKGFQQTRFLALIDRPMPALEHRLKAGFGRARPSIDASLLGQMRCRHPVPTCVRACLNSP